LLALGIDILATHDNNDPNNRIYK